MLAVVLALAVLAAGCSSSTSSSSARPSPTRAAASCAWYTPTALPQGEQVILIATGSTCGAAAPVVEFAAVRLRATWYSTAPDVDPGAALTARLVKGGVIVRIYQLGSGAETARRAGQLADDFQAAGWTIAAR